ncbi:unnamed protein product [Ambrosiozyma monospora]|uniref:Unnamed protein product n=1 Tax=Ambrosiozyma monospora TaxID=43982 RepID=A0ACB5TNK9_AMBMO|nr:unnamed protein product [Ambrosiozyma monospora]
MRLRQKLIVVERISTRFTGATSNVWGSNSETRPDVGAEEDAIESDLNHAQSGADYSKDTIKKILDWDLWGPLIITLSFSLVVTYLQTRSLNLGSSENEGHSSEIFSGAFTLIWGALAVLALNIQLTSPVQQKTENGGLTSGIIGLSFFQCLSILCYTFFPVLLGATISIFVKWKWVRMVIGFVMLSWSMLCTWLLLAIVNNCKTKGTPSFIYGGFGDDQEEESSEGDKRIFLMIYPVFLVFALFSWLCVIV